MSAAPQPLEPDRVARGLDRLLDHCELVGRLEAVDEPRLPARVRLEQALGPELATVLLSGLGRAPRD